MINEQLLNSSFIKGKKWEIMNEVQLVYVYIPNKRAHVSILSQDWGPYAKTLLKNSLSSRSLDNKEQL